MTNLSDLYGSGTSGGGTGDTISATGMPQLLPDIFSLDDTNTNVSRGNAFNAIETLDFGSGEDGSAWISLYIPDEFDDSTDLNLELLYNLSGSDDSKIVTIITEYWLLTDSETLETSTPDGTNNDDISTGTGNDGLKLSHSLSVIPSSSIISGNLLTLKITRLGSADTYTGTFQMLCLIPS